MENGTRRPHILMVTVPAAGHCAPFIQLLYLLRHHKNVRVTVAGHPVLLGDMAKLQERGDFGELEIQFEAVFGYPPLYTADPKFPVRAALASAHAEVEFQPLKERLLEEKHSAGAPTSIISDKFFWWTKDIADEMGIPWYPFFTTAAWFGLCALESGLLRERDLHPIRSSQKFSRVVEFPGMNFSYVYDIPHECIEFPEFYAGLRDRTLRSTGILCNTAFELEGSSSTGSLDAVIQLVESRKIDRVKTLEDTKVYAIGPITQISGFGEQSTSTDDLSGSLTWLDTQVDGSVLYVCFGSVGNLMAEVIPQLARGLEESAVPFLWVLKAPPGQTVDQVLPEGFRTRTQGRGFIETGWAPQSRILTHPATGGFLTHSGWNSTLESMCSAVPMITWPLSADQPLNARFVTDVKKVGVPIKDGPLDDFSTVTKEDISKAVKRLLVSDEGKEIKKNSVEVRKSLVHTVREGGASYANLRYFINQIVLV